MKHTKIISAAAVCLIASVAVFGVNAINQPNSAQEISAHFNADSEVARYAEQVAILVNQERAANGLKPVRFSPNLSEAATIRAEEITQSFSHTRPNGSSCFTAITELGISYRAAAENIAYGQKTPESVMNAWMNSSGHRANILSKKMDYIGVGVVYRNGTYYWTQFFAASDQLSDNSYLPGETTATITTTVKTSTTEKTTTSTAAPSTTVTHTSAGKPAETTSTTKKTTTVTTSKTTSAESQSTTASNTTTAAASTSVTQQTPDVSDTETSAAATTTACPNVTGSAVTSFSFGDNCSGVGVGVFIFKGSN